MKKIAIILSGCGVYDGAEIHESVMTMLAITKQGAEYEIYAPNREQHHVVNHITGEEMSEKRNILIESARIARGNIKPLEELNVQNIDAVIFPGGFGVAKNFCNYAFKGADYTISKDIEIVITDAVNAKIPVGALCISPVLLAKALKNPKITIGNDANTSAHIEQQGAIHEITNKDGVAIDENYKLVTAPCYMLEATVADIAAGAENVVQAILKMIG